MNKSKDIIDTLVSQGGFGILLQAINTTELGEMLKTRGPYTLFAPTDEAFGRLKEEVVQKLNDPDETDRLREVVMYHMLNGTKAMKKHLLDKWVMKMGNGDTAMVNLAQATQVVFPRGSTTVTEADILASNGVIHVVNIVMMPK